jgi:alcohol dehydrogenase
VVTQLDNCGPTFLGPLAAQKVGLPGLVMHRFGLDEIQEAYDVFGDAARTGAIKVALLRDGAVLRQGQ